MASIAREDRWAAEWLAERGIRISESKLTRWRHAGLWPPAHVPAETAEAHWRLLASVHGQGRSVEASALTLAASGYGCEALRAVLRDRLAVGLPDDTTGSPYVASAAEQLAAGFDTAVDEGSTVMAGLWRTLRARVRDKDSSVPGEPGELLWPSFAVDLAEALLGADAAFEPEVLGDALDARDGDIASGWSFMRAGRELHGLAYTIVERAPVDVLARCIAGARSVVAVVHELVGAARPDDDTLTLQAAMLTPYLLAAAVSSTTRPMVEERFSANSAAIAAGLGLANPQGETKAGDDTT